MRSRRLGFAWAALALTLALASCVSPEELRREDEATCAGYGFHPGTDAFASCLQERKAWPGGPYLRIHPIGVGVTGVADPGHRIGVKTREYAEVCLTQAPRPSELPMFARHVHRTRARYKWAAGGTARWWCRKLQHHVTPGYPESSFRWIARLTSCRRVRPGRLGGCS